MSLYFMQTIQLFQPCHRTDRGTVTIVDLQGEAAEMEQVMAASVQILEIFNDDHLFFPEQLPVPVPVDHQIPEFLKPPEQLGHGRAIRTGQMMDLLPPGQILTEPGTPLNYQTRKKITNQHQYIHLVPLISVAFFLIFAHNAHA